jgi:hypothetical protein
MSLFAVIYNCSQIIISNLFQQKKASTGLSGLKYIGPIFRLYEYIWNRSKHAKLKKLAKNVIKMGSTLQIY